MSPGGSVVFKSDKLEKIRGAAHALDVLGNWPPVLTVVLGAIGVPLARRHRRAMVTTALGAAGAELVLIVGLVIVRHYYPVLALWSYPTVLTVLLLLLILLAVLAVIALQPAATAGRAPAPRHHRHVPGRRPPSRRWPTERGAD